MPQATLTRHPHGVTAVDTEYVRPGLAAAHLVQSEGRAAFVDVGTSRSVPYLLDALAQLGVARDAVDFVFLTHAHMDHVGGAGQLLRELPQARAIAHPRAAPHLIDPAKLAESTRAVYGDSEYERLFGDVLPIAAERISVTRDLERIRLGTRELEVVHTPGHALHHHCLVDLAHACLFAGDTFGVSYRELDTERGPFIVPTTTPTQFDPDQLEASIERLLAYRPQAIYVMHYSRLGDVAPLGASLRADVRALAALALRHADGPAREAVLERAIHAHWLARLRAHGSTLPSERIQALLALDAELNASGLLGWLDRRRRAS